MKTLNEVIKANECCDHGEPDSRCEDCPYKGIGACCAERETDALHYLKEYRENKSGLEKTKAALEVKKKIYEDMTEKIMQQGQENEARCQAEIARYQEAVKNCERAENLYKQKQKAAEDALWKIASDPNEPLTWDELRTMTGKPVWIEEHWAPMEDEAGVTEDEGDIDAYWAILTYSDEKKISVVNGSVDQWLHKNLWNNHNVSHSWTAYRKERS